MRIRSAFWILFLAGFAGSMAMAQVRKAKPKPSPTASSSTAGVAAAGSSASCSAPTYRQFDFWLGEWDIVGADGKKTGDDKVVQILGGCALQETWTGTKSGQGMSISAYDPATRRWHQTLVDDSGAVLTLEGDFADGKMVLIGRRPSQKEKGVTIVHRIAWTPTADHRVRQQWEASTNEGRTWRPVSESTYVPQR
jgi:hypothetical protein